jgi:branched-chain amino acid transport system substrate-binding protein
MGRDQPVVRDIKQTQPDVIFSTAVGQATAHLYQCYADAGLDPKVTPIASLTTTEAEVGLMGADVGAGHITAASYFEGVETEANSVFVSKYKKRFGDNELTNMCVEAAYFQVHIFAKALAATNTMDTDILRPMVLGSEFDAPQGRVSIDVSNSHTDLWTRVGKANRLGRFDIVRESRMAVKSDPYLISL